MLYGLAEGRTRNTLRAGVVDVLGEGLGGGVGHDFCDLWVEDVIVVELKVAPEITNRHRAQTLSSIRVHYELGPGFLHPVYRNAARLELNAQQIGCVYLRELPVTYEGQHTSSRRCFLLVLEDKVLLCAFAARDYTPARQDAFATQMRRHLKYLGKELGLLANFCGERLVVTPVRLGKRLDCR